MTQNPTTAANEGMPIEGEPGSYAGWYLGIAVIVAVLAVGFGLWFAYHG